MNVNRTVLFMFAVQIMVSTEFVSGQAGVSSSSVGIARAGISRIDSSGRYQMPPAKYFRVDEFVNYHRHELPLPRKGENVRLDVRTLKLDDQTVFQVGITTPRKIDPKSIPPLNLVLVIDRSGSMSTENRLQKVKKAIFAMLERFRPHDRISIVAFGSKAETVLKPTRKTQLKDVSNAIQRIHPGGITNLHGGLMLGYKIALDHYKPEQTNRVILLTDGIANSGVTSPAAIAKDSRRFNQKGISLSTIGVGSDFNHTLLRELADTGKGLLHFVGDDQDICKTFVKEADSLLSPLARKVYLKLDFSDLECRPNIFGYQTLESDKTGVTIPLDDLNHGVTQVVVGTIPRSKSNRILASLTYTDITSGESRCIKSRCSDQKKSQSHRAIKRNYAIGVVATSIQNAAVHSTSGENPKAYKALKKGIKRARLLVDSNEDEHVNRIVKIAKSYQAKLKPTVEQ